MNEVFTENMSLVLISLPFDDFVRTRVFPQARDCNVLSISLSSTC